MIVADVNLVAYLPINGPFTSAARAALVRDPHWIAPSLWRHEFLNILATSVRQKYVVLARRLSVPLVTADRKLVDQFPDVVISLGDFAAGK